MNSLEKIDAFKDALLRTDEQFDGLLGLVQGAVGMEKLGMGGVSLSEGLTDDPAELDESLLDVAGFVLWLRSDDAPTADPETITQRIPDAIAELASAAGIIR